MPSWYSTYWLSYDTLMGFSWDNAFVLYGILGIPFLFLLRSLFHGQFRQSVELPFVYANIQSSWVSYLRFVPPLIVALGLCCILLALARPQRPQQKNDDRDGVDIIMALDISESMLEKDFSPNRLEAAKDIIKTFVKTRKNDRIGLVVFAGSAYSLCPLTNDYDLILEYVQDINTGLITESGTAIGDALAVGINRMREVSSNSKAIILLSDGESLAGNLPPNMAAQLAQKFHIKVYPIAIGTTLSGENPVDLKSLKEIARFTQGKFFNAATNKALNEVFREIDKIERRKLETIRQPMDDYYGIYINWAIVFLLLVLLLKSSFMANVFED